MKHFNFKSVALSLVAIVGASTIGTSAANFTINPQSRFGQKLQTVHPVREFRGKKPFSVEDLKNKVSAKKGDITTYSSVDEPVTTYDDLRQYDYLEGPDGSTWFYTAEFESDFIDVSEWYQEEIIKAFTFTIYNDRFEEIGQIHDTVTLKEDEKKPVAIVLDPAVTTKFFNTDSKPEVMVYLAINTATYKNRYYNKVYSVGGQKDAEGNDISIADFDGRCVDTVNAAAPGQEENFYFTFVEDIEPNVEDFGNEYQDFIDYINAYANRVIVYAKANGENGPSPIQSKDIFLSNIPGDTTDGIYFISKVVDDKLYLVYSYYEKPYFIDPTGFGEDDRPTPDNALRIETYSTTGNTPALVSTTDIPVESMEVPGQLIYTFYSIGSVAWKNDVDMMVNGTPDAPAFIVARDWANAATLEDILSSYDIYGSNGQLIKTLATDTESIVVLADIPGKQPQLMFVKGDENGAYTFSFANLYEGTPLFSLDQDNNGDPISAACNRYPTPDGSYKYAFEMSYWDIDDNGIECARVAWFNPDGTFDRIDKIPLGPNVMAAMVNMDPNALDPHLYDTDDAMEYAVLVKRVQENTTRDEFIVVDDNGKLFAHFSEDDGKGAPYLCILFLQGEQKHLMITYNGDNGYNVDLYDLPFLNPADETGSVDSVVSDVNKLGLTYNGSTVNAPEATIEVYNTSGIRVAEGFGSISVESLGAGVYVVSAKDAMGNKASAKIVR